MTDKELLNENFSLRIIRIDKDNFVNGPGIRTIIWVAGCDHKCSGCHNPETHSVRAGKLLDQKHLDTIRSELAKDYVHGVTITGGDPLMHENREQSLRLAEWLNTNFPDKTIIMYTGYVYDKLDLESQKTICKTLDWLIDGPYKKDLPRTQWRGSTK